MAGTRLGTPRRDFLALSRRPCKPPKRASISRIGAAKPIQSRGSERSLRVLPGGARVPGGGWIRPRRRPPHDPNQPGRGQWAEAKLAEKRKESRSAEAHLRRAVELAPQQVGKIIELARFLTKQGRYQEADQSFERAEKVAPNSPRVVFARASIYIEAHHNLDVARELLKRYMSMDPARRSAQVGSCQAPSTGAGRLSGPCSSANPSASARRRCAPIQSVRCSPAWEW
jgi:tetratricopeptide (TPR) repeat protein